MSEGSIPAEWMELLQLLKQQVASTGEAEPKQAVVDRIQALSTVALSGISSDAAVSAAAAASAPDREQLLELLLSTLKVIEAGGFADVDYGEVQNGDAWCVATARIAAALASSTQRESSGDDSASGGALAMLPWLVLFGRCCLYLHKHLQKSEMTSMFFPQGSAALDPASFMRQLQGKPGVDWYRLWEGPRGVFIAKQPAQLGAAEEDEGDDSTTSAEGLPQFGLWLGVLAAWLQDSSTSAQLAAAGLSTQCTGLLQDVEATTGTLQVRLVGWVGGV